MDQEPVPVDRVARRGPVPPAYLPADHARHRGRGRKDPPRRPSRYGVSTDDEYSADAVEFLMAVDRYKRERRRPHPTYAEILAVALALGYRKAPPTED